LHPAASREGVLVEFAGLLVLAQRGQVDRETVRGGEGAGVVAAEDATASGKGGLVELARLVVLAPFGQFDGAFEGVDDRVGVVVEEGAAARIERPGHGSSAASKPIRLVQALIVAGRGVSYFSRAS
jgi:hypothetical protein